MRSVPIHPAVRISERRATGHPGPLDRAAATVNVTETTGNQGNFTHAATDVRRSFQKDGSPPDIAPPSLSQLLPGRNERPFSLTRPTSEGLEMSGERGCRILAD